MMNPEAQKPEDATVPMPEPPGRLGAIVRRLKRTPSSPPGLVPQGSDGSGKGGRE